MRHSVQVQIPLLLLLAGVLAIVSLYQYLLKHETESHSAEVARSLKAVITLFNDPVERCVSIIFEDGVLERLCNHIGIPVFIVIE